MNNQEEQFEMGVIEAFNKYFNDGFYEDVKIISHYETEEDDINKYIDIIQNEKEIKIEYKIINKDDLDERVKQYFYKFYKVLQCKLKYNGTDYLHRKNEILTDSCCVCLNDYNIYNKKVLTCGHSVCSDCYKKLDYKCPYCRAKIYNTSELYKDIVKVIKNEDEIERSKEDEIKELNKIFDYDGFVKNVITVKFMDTYKIFDFIADDGDYFYFQDGIIIYNVIDGNLEQDKQKKDLWDVSIFSIFQKLMTKINKPNINQEELIKLRKQVNFYLKILKS
jgi:hypothetical protein